jgi:hypothetical protein
MTMRNPVGKDIVIRVPYYNAKDVKFLEEIKQAHNHNKLTAVSADVEKAFKKRVEDEFLGQVINSKVRASITEFCEYLLSICKFFGYSLLTSGIVTSIHKDQLSIKTRSTTGNDALLKATFTYFDSLGTYKLTANGFMRWDLMIAPDDPHNRRLQILRDNNGTLPGYSDTEELCKTDHIHVDIYMDSSR